MSDSVLLKLVNSRTANYRELRTLIGVTPMAVPPPPDSIPDERKHEYGKLYYEQNKLLWSRLQTAYLLEAVTLAGYYALIRDDKPSLAAGLILLTSIMLILLTAITQRDGLYLRQMREAGWLPLGEVDHKTTFGLAAKTLAVWIPFILLIANTILAISTLAPVVRR